MLESIFSAVTHGAEISSAVGHSSQTAIAAVLCAAFISFFS
ncbi:YshB family small membrane protein [Dickeya undicola]|nr:YshB family small membrane protein [Dickeya undicola]